jgi:hypothetical protein
MLLSSCSPKFNFKKLSKQIEEKNNIEYPVQGSSRPYSKCNIEVRKDFLNEILKKVKIKNSDNNIFIEYHDGTGDGIYYALKVEKNVYYYGRDTFLDCKNGKELFFPQMYEHGFENLVKYILLDLGKDLSFDKLLRASKKYRTSHAGPVYLTVFDIEDNKITINKTLTFNYYYNIEYDDW